MKKSCSIAAGMWIVLETGLLAQTLTTGEVAGWVRDPSGAVVAGATLVLKSVETGELRTTESVSSGGYRFTFLKPGTYQISAASTDLKSDSGTLIIAVGQVQTLDCCPRNKTPALSPVM